MNIFDEISAVENEITRKLSILELDLRFQEFVEILNKKLTEIRQEFIKIEKKSHFDVQNFLAKLKAFLEDDVESVIKLYNHHKNNQLSIYDDSSQTINDSILSKENEVEQFIKRVADENYDASLESYLRTKYELIKHEYQTNLNQALRHKEQYLKIAITNTSPEIPFLSIYGDCELVKKIYLNELTLFLEIYIKDFNDFLESKKRIQEKELLIESTIKYLKMENLLPLFLEKKQNYQENISGVASIHIAIAGSVPIFGPIQNQYIKELDKLYSEILGKNIDIYHQIKKIHQEIAEIITELEKNDLLKDLVDILKHKRDTIEQTFINNPNKTTLEWQKYLIDLTLFLEQDVKYLLNIHHQHSKSDISIYDDSTPELNENIKMLEQNIEKYIVELEKEYNSGPILNYLKRKYKHISKNYYDELAKTIQKNQKNLENKLLNKNADFLITLYPDCETLKKQFIKDLTIFLEINLKKISELEQINKQINESITSLETRIKSLNNEALLTKLNVIKEWFNEYLEININKTFIVSELQTIYLNKIMELEKQVITEENNKRFENLAPNYFKYLTNTDIKRISFSKLIEIFEYLKENVNTELSELLINVCYKIIKYELIYQKNNSYLYERLNNRAKLKIEQLFLEDIKQNKKILQENGCLEQFLKAKFSLKLLTSFVEITMNDDSLEYIHEHSQELLENRHHQKKFCIEDLTAEKMKFDENGECLVKNSKNEYFIINRNGTVKKVVFYHSDEDRLYQYAPEDVFTSITYHNGILKYNYSYDRYHYNGCIGDFMYIGTSSSINIVDIKKMNNECSGIISEHSHNTNHWKHYDGLVFYYKNGELIAKTLTGEPQNSKYLNSINRKFRLEFHPGDELAVHSEPFYIKGFPEQYFLSVTHEIGDGIKYQYFDEFGKCHFCIHSKKKPKELAEETALWQGIHCLAFEHLYTILYDEKSYDEKGCEIREAIILDHNFQKSFAGILGSPCFLVNDTEKDIKYFISKIDKQTYILSNGNLIQMSLEEIYNHYLVDRYIIAKNKHNDLLLIKKSEYYFDSIFDVLTEINSKTNQNDKSLPSTTKK